MEASYNFYFIEYKIKIISRVLTLHTQGFSQDENVMISQELNYKFGFKTKVVKHKNKFVVQFTTSDANKLHDLIKPYLIPTMQYKLPRKL